MGYLDGEIIVGSPTAKDCFNKTSSAVMSFDGEPEFSYYIFDRMVPGTYEDRFLRWELLATIETALPYIKVLRQDIVLSLRGLEQYEQEQVSLGYEGIMIRDPNGLYKYGRSTVNEGILLKLKRFQDFEATVIGFEERMHNANEATTDELGHTKRSSHQDNMIPENTLGSLICKSEQYEQTFKVGTGFDDNLRLEIWNNQNKYLNKSAKIKSQLCGEKDKPRFPVFLGWRED